MSESLAGQWVTIMEADTTYDPEQIGGSCHQTTIRIHGEELIPEELAYFTDGFVASLVIEINDNGVKGDTVGGTCFGPHDGNLNHTEGYFCYNFISHEEQNSLFMHAL